MTTKTLKINYALARDKQYPSTPDILNVNPNADTVTTISKMESKISDAKPTPLEFDTFIPWLCRQWQVPYQVVVKRMLQEEYLRYDGKLSQSSRSKSSKIKLKETEDSEIKIERALSTCDLNAIPISAYYDIKGQLVEIAIVKSPFIHCKVISALSVIFPFHSHLAKLTIKKCLTSEVLHKIAALIPHSNITELCFDDNDIPQGNYFELLDKPSRLNCSINDVICKEIVIRIDFGQPGMTLSVLSLASNAITDIGAWYIGGGLRKNRYLLHLNLADNSITDKGLKYIMTSLTEFPLTIEEILEKKRRNFQFLRKKIETYNDYLEKTMQQQASLEMHSTPRHCSFVEKTKPLLKKKSVSPKPTNIIKTLSIPEIAEKITNEIVGDFIDPFDDLNTRIKDGYVYCIGNFTLCSINLAYNRLDFCSVQKILDVLLYQKSIKPPYNGTKLMRLVLEGNVIPTYCNELSEIDMLLKQTKHPQGLSISTLSTPFAKTKTSSKVSRTISLM